MNLNVPTIYTPEQLLDSNTQAGLPDGRWVAARPLGWQGWSLRTRIQTAWKVFTGRWDALRWEGQE